MSLKLYLIDTHAHLCAKEYDNDREGVIQNAFDADVKKIINVGASVEESLQVVKLAKNYENIWAAVGIHPNECNPLELRPSASSERKLSEIENLAREPKVVAIGETGLDFAPPAFKRNRQI